MSDINISKDDVLALKKQIDITDEDAKKLIIKHKGDLVECVLDSYNFKDTISDKKKKKDELSEIRNIVDEKNKLYNQNIINNPQINNQTVKII